MLQDIRAKIDQLDSQLVKLLNERMRLVEEVGRVKKERGQAIFAPEREELLLQGLERQNTGPLSRVGLRAIYREILSASRANQRRLRIIYLGAEVSDNFLAARMRFGSSDCYRSEPNWASAALALEKGEAEVAVVPRAALVKALSSSAGEKPFAGLLRICGEVELHRELVKEENETQGGGETTDQYFILALCGGALETADKTLLTMIAPPEGLAERLNEEAALHGQKMLRVEALGVGKKMVRHLCEVMGAPTPARWREWAEKNWGRQAQVTWLGSYPRPQA